VASPEEIEAMIVRVGLGDRAAFSALYDATAAKLFGVCLRILRNRADAEEALQDVFVRVWQKAGSFAANGLSPMAWLVTLARNLSIDRLRARKAPAQDLASVPDLRDAGPTPEASAVAASERARIETCLGALDGGRAEAVRGAYLEGWSYQDLAERFGVPLNTMRTWLRRSLMKLRECLGG
jgi:RNA polymerase sigma-70 factor, ECF subfamily